MAKTVLVINSGSSSIKYQLVDLETGEGIASGLVEKIGEPVDGHYKHEFNGEKHELEEPIHDHEQGLKRVLGFQLPKAASTYALNKEIADQYHIRRYGAHGTSHEFISSVVPSVIGKPAEGLKQIVLHIGNGASASAEVSGKPVETSMGLTPLEGLMMGGRTGDIDPAVVFHLIRNAHMNVDELDALFNKRSGMMGMTGFGDLREVHRLVAEGNEDAKLALDVYVHRIVGYIGNYTAQMGGVDVITFTAGVGENDDVVRKMVCDKLAPFGVKLDEEKNATRSKEPRIISTPDSKITICVIPTNEELAIARKSAAIAEAGEDTYGNVFSK